MGITLKKFNEHSVDTTVSDSGISTQLSLINITNLTSIEIDGSLTQPDGTTFTFVVSGSFDISSFKTPPKTLADLLLSNANLFVNTYSSNEDGLLNAQYSSTSPVSLSTFVYSNTSLTNLNSYYSGNDVFYSCTNNVTLGSNDTVYGYGGNDTYHDNHLLISRNDLFYGGEGTDTGVLPGKYTNYTIKAGAVWDDINKNTDLTGFTITDNTKTHNTLQINQVERVQFSDGTLAVDFSQGQSGYKSAMMIGAAFGQSYVNAYFSAGLSLYDQGQSNLQVATIIVNAGLIESQIGSTSNTAWLDFVYKNVTGVAPDKLTEAIFVNDLNTGVYTKASLLALAAGVSNLEQQIGLTGLQQTGLLYHSFI
jgi:hypothetical protein